MQDVHYCALVYAQATIVPMVIPWMIGLAIVMVVWTGVTVAFGGSFNMGTIVSMILTLGLVFGLLQSYFVTGGAGTFLGLNGGVAWTIANGADIMSQRLFNIADATFGNAYQQAALAVSRQNARLEEYNLLTAKQAFGRIGTHTLVTGAGGAAFGGWGAIPASILGFAGGVVSTVGRAWGQLDRLLWAMTLNAIMYGFLFVINFAYWLIMAQYLWSYFGLAVLSMLGPIFIPFFLFSQTEEYFWGWLKALLQYAFLMITAGVMYVVVAMLLVAPLTYATNVQPPYDSDSGFAGLIAFFGALWTQYLPVIVMALMGAFQVGSISHAMTSGAAPPGAGLLGRFMQLGALGGGLAAGRAWAQARYSRWQEGRQRVLSERTRRQRQAMETARGTLPGGGGAGGGSGPGAAGGPGDGPQVGGPQVGGPQVGGGADTGGGGPRLAAAPRPRRLESHGVVGDFIGRLRNAHSATEMRRIVERYAPRITELHKKEATL